MGCVPAAKTPARLCIALAAVKRIDPIFAIERELNGRLPENRARASQETSKPLVEALEIWLQAQRGTLSRSAAVAKPIDYMLKRWDRFAAFLDDGRICRKHPPRAAAYARSDQAA